MNPLLANSVLVMALVNFDQMYPFGSIKDSIDVDCIRWVEVPNCCSIHVESNSTDIAT